MINKVILAVASDNNEISGQILKYLQKIDVNVMIMTLTEICEMAYHAGIEINKKYIDIIKPRKVCFTHMGEHCDYDEVMRISLDNAVPTYDNMNI